MPNYLQKMILNSSNSNSSDTAPQNTDQFKIILDQSSLSKKKFNKFLQAMGWLVDVPAELESIFVAGDWILRDSIEPGKLSIMMLWCTDSS